MTTQPVVDNQPPVVEGNAAPLASADPGATANPSPSSQTADPVVEMAKSQSWKSGLGDDMQNSALIQKFDDSPDGLRKAFESHDNLEKLLGHEKVPIPKDADDVEGWNRFSKAMGIPDKAEGYGLADSAYPEEMGHMKDAMMSKDKFAEIMHAHKLTPDQAKGLWQELQRTNVDAFNQATNAHKASITEVSNQLRGEWGDAYDTNVDLAQTVINKFSPDQETNDAITATMLKDPSFVKFLSKVGSQFSENKIGDFAMKQFSLTPEMAKDEIDAIVRDKNHPYNNEAATPREHSAAIDYVNSLYSSINRARG